MSRRAAAGILEEPKEPRRDWSSRARSSAAHALRYSKFVSVMKRMLSLGAFAVIAAVLAFFFVQRQPRRLQFAYERMGLIKNDLAMIKPRLSGADSDGNPFVITAEAAIQDAGNLQHARLSRVQADLMLGKQSWIDAAAASGVVDMRAGTLALDGGLSVYSDGGYELHTAHADVDLKRGIVHGPQPVTGHGPFGTLSAARFQIDRATRQISLEGQVHMTLNPHSGQPRAGGAPKATP